MTVTVSLDSGVSGYDTSGSKFIRRGTFTWDSSYPLGGEAVTKTLFALGVTMDDLRIDNGSGIDTEFDKTNLKVKAYWPRLGLSTATVGVKHDASAATNGVAVYVHVDETIEQGTVLCHLEAVNAGTADSYLCPYSGGPRLPVQYDAAAATGATALFINEDDTAGLRFSTDFDRVGGTDTSPAVLLAMGDGTHMRIWDQDNPAGETGTVQVYFDDDAANDYQRLLFVSPTTTNATDRLWVNGGEVPEATDLSAFTHRFVAVGV